MLGERVVTVSDIGDRIGGDTTDGDGGGRCNFLSFDLICRSVQRKFEFVSCSYLSSRHFRLNKLRLSSRHFFTYLAVDL